jgi:threonine dehydrogenase-like Zn-dependent dehydrogenase
MPGTEATLIDCDPSRQDKAARFGAGFASVADGREDADVVYHCSGSEAGLATALAAAGTEATVVEVSWYGDRAVAAPLGLAFHSRRLRLIASQVGSVSGGHRPRWSTARRLAKALQLLADDRLDELITEEIGFAALPEELPRLLAPRARGLHSVVRYDDAIPNPDNSRIALDEATPPS